MKLFGFKVEKMKTWFQKAKGIMFRKKLTTAVVFDMNFESKANSAIHSFFVYVPFDVVFLNSKKKIVDMKTVNPWTFLVVPKKAAQYIIEIPKGTIKKHKLTMGQKIKLD